LPALQPKRTWRDQRLRGVGEGTRAGITARRSNWRACRPMTFGRRAGR